jgi:tetratricopeptide (TPR) repeat protein
MALLLKLIALNENSENYRKSIDLYEKCLIHRKIFIGGRDTITAKLYLKLGTAFECSNYPKKALICYDKSTKFGEANSLYPFKAFSKKLNLLLKLGRVEEAAECLEEEQYQVKGTQEAELLALQGQVFERSNDDTQAMICYNKAVSIFEHEKQTGLNVARVKADKANLLLKGNLYEEAKLCLSEALSQSEGLMRAEIMVMRGQIFESESKKDQAMKCYERAISILSSSSKDNIKDSYQTKSHHLLLAKTKYFMGCIQGKNSD